MEDDDQAIKDISKIFKKSITDNDIIDIKQMDECYERIKEMLIKKNEIINKWYDDDYYSDLKGLRENSNKFLSKVSERECFTLQINYDK